MKKILEKEWIKIKKISGKRMILKSEKIVDYIGSVRQITFTLQLEVSHDKIPSRSMTSHDFYDLFCTLG